MTVEKKAMTTSEDNGEPGGLNPDLLLWVGASLQQLWTTISGAERAVVAEVDNFSDVTFKKCYDYHSWGGFSSPPRALVDPSTRQGFTSGKKTGVKGAEGWLVYSFDADYNLMLYWDNPIIDSNKGCMSFIPKSEPLSQDTMKKYTKQTIPENGKYRCGMTAGTGHTAKFNYYVYSDERIIN